MSAKARKKVAKEICYWSTAWFGMVVIRLWLVADKAVRASIVTPLFLYLDH
jgi:hypothetical protein